MKYDIGDLLSSWPFDPDELVARRIVAKDGSEKIQIRIDMGMLQLETTGRPDAQRPFGCESLLEHYRKNVDQDGSAASPDDAATLDEAACEDLFQEAWQYYQRYLSMFYLEDYEAVVTDARHNLDIFDLVHSHADNDEVKWFFEQYYPHAIMMETRANTMIALDQDDYQLALRKVRDGIERIEEFVADWDGDVMEDDLPELSFLQDWYEELEMERPLSRREQLERDLTVAVESENFEEAARLRDKIHTLRPTFRGPSPERSPRSPR